MAFVLFIIIEFRELFHALLESLKVGYAIAALDLYLAVVKALEGGAEQVGAWTNAGRAQARTRPIDGSIR